VWEGFDGHYTQIYTQKIGTDASPIQLTSDAHWHDYPQVSGDRVVWQGSDASGYTQIYTEKIGTDASPIQLTSDAQDHGDPQVSGDRIVWDTVADLSDSSSPPTQIFTAAPSNDTTPPTTTLSVVPAPNAAGWNHTSVTVTLAASDGPTGSGVAGTLYRLGSGPEFLYSAPFLLSAQGATTIQFGSEDNVGNTETVKSATIRIDSRKPTSTASRNLIVVRGRRVTVPFKISDPLPSCGKAKVTITVKLRSRTVKTISLANVLTNRARSYSLKVTLARGSYSWTVKATDIAGNAGKVSAAKKLVVR
jgi:hypothetical protein